MLEMVTDMTSRGKKHEYLSAIIVQMNFSVIFGIYNNPIRNIHIMKVLIEQKPQRKYRPTIS